MMPRARYRRCASIAALFGVLLPAQLAFGSDAELRRQDVEHPPHFAVEARFGAYHPDVDAAFKNGAAPYKGTFGNDVRFMAGIEVDWQFLHVEPVGSLAIGGKIGYFQAAAAGQYADPPYGPSGETVRLEMVPAAALIVGRLDWIARRTWVPIVPYAKIGPDVAFWSSSNGRGVSNINGRVGQGKTFGFEWAVGGAVLLDVLDRQAAKAFGNDIGIRHSYLFGELTQTVLHGIGQSNALWLGDLTWNLGLTFEM